jgi:hypothetical protein
MLILVIVRFAASVLRTLTEVANRVWRLSQTAHHGEIGQTMDQADTRDTRQGFSSDRLDS